MKRIVENSFIWVFLGLKFFIDLLKNGDNYLNSWKMIMQSV